jgi:hypothetical protein
MNEMDMTFDRGAGTAGMAALPTGIANPYGGSSQPAIR